MKEKMKKKKKLNANIDRNAFKLQLEKKLKDD